MLGAKTKMTCTFTMFSNPVDNFGTVVGENPTPYGVLALWAVNGLSIVYWEGIFGITFKYWLSS